MKANGISCLVVLILTAVISNISQSEVAQGDLKPIDYKSINQALNRADEMTLPHCTKDSCPQDITHLIRAAALRIRWKLSDSLQEARICEKLATKNHDVTRYACARLIHSDATNLYGYHGYWSTIDLVADALKQGYANRTWGHSSAASSNPTILEADRLRVELRRYHFIKNTVEYNSVNSVPLVGDGKQKTYSYDGHNPTTIRTIINYPSVHVDANGEDLVMLLDTGSAVTTLYESSARRLGIKPIDLDHSYARGVTGANGRTEIGILKSLKFANLTLKNIIVDIVRPGRYTVGDGIVGLDIIDKIPSLMFTKTKLLINPPAPSNCDGTFTMSSDLYTGINGIVATGSDFNGVPVVAVLDTGNAAAAVSPTWGLVERHNLSVTGRSRDVVGTFDGPRSFESGRLKGSVQYLGLKRSGEMKIGSAYPDGWIDLNIGMPYFYGKNLYINFENMKICISH